MSRGAKVALAALLALWLVFSAACVRTVHLGSVAACDRFLNLMAHAVRTEGRYDPGARAEIARIASDAATANPAVKQAARSLSSAVSSNNGPAVDRAVSDLDAACRSAGVY